MAKTATTLAWDGQSEILPAQVPQLSMARLEPVKRLMLAVLERAVNDLHTYASVPTARGKRLFTEADAWFRSSAGGPFDFETICHATELDPDFIRNGLRSPNGPGQRTSVNVTPRAKIAVPFHVKGSVGEAPVSLGSMGSATRRAPESITGRTRWRDARWSDDRS
jgi:hypothetical protein